MMLHVIWIGKTKESFVREGIRHYFEALSHCIEVEITEIADMKGQTDTEKIRKHEAEKIGQSMRKGIPYFLLDEQGKSFSSQNFSVMLSQALDREGKVGFVIGGAWGFSPQLKKFHQLLSLSSLTFPHEIVRVILLEQLYRAMMILQGKSYHH